MESSSGAVQPIRAVEGYYAVTFLLFLASLGLLNYILRRSDEAAEAGGTGRKIEAEAEGAATATTGLLSLGRALEEEGRGKSPEVTPAAEGAKDNTAGSGILAPVIRD